MSLVARLAGARPAPIHHTATRSYSILSKSGNGRFLTNAKPPKSLRKASSPGSSTSSAVTAVISNSSESMIETSSSSSTTTTSGEDGTQELEGGGAESRTESHSHGPLTQPAAAVSVSNADNTSDKKQDSQSSTSSTTASSSSTPFSSPGGFLSLEEMSVFHPRPTREVLSLHSFFSLHRPLLLLPSHASQPLFNSASTSSTLFGQMMSSTKSESDPENNSLSKEESSSESTFEVEVGSGKPLQQADLDDVETSEADADAARLLGRTFVVNRLGSFVDWQDVLRTLGDSQARTDIDAIQSVAEETVAKADTGVAMDSVKRKKKRKMNKHIYKKRRKKERAQRRRLGK